MEERRAYIRRELDGVFREWSARAAFSGAAIFLLLSPLDFYAVPAHATRFLVFRIAIACLLTGAGLFLRRPRSPAATQATVFLCVLASAAVLEAMILDFGGHQSPYLIGLILVAVTVLGLIPAGPAFSSVLAGTIFAVYLGPILARDTLEEPRFFAVEVLLFAAILATGVFIDWLHVRRLAHEIELRYDLTASREEHAGREDRLRLFAAAVEAAAESIFILDPQGRVIFCNSAAAAQTGRAPAEIVGRDVRQMYLDPGVHDDIIVPALRRTGHWAGEFAGTDPAGMPVKVWLSASMIRDAEGRPVAMIGITKDVSEQRRVEDELIRTQKLESIGVLAGGLAHDFNNLLTIILGNLDLARLFAGAVPSAAEAIDHASEAALRAGDLTRQLLTFSKGGQPVKRVGDIVKTVRETVAFAAAGSNISCAYEVAEGVPRVEFDEGQMRQVVHNLVQNAREAMPGGGMLRVCARPVRVKAGEIAGLRAGPYLLLEFRDRGSGIDRAHLSQIFDPYFSTKEMDSVKGRGLGLAVSFAIVRSHGGTMTADSSANEGTRISVYLPEARPAPDAPREDADAGAIAASADVSSKVLGDAGSDAPGRGRVLVMDDEPLVLDMAGAALRQLGYAPTLARSAAEAIVQYQIGLDRGRRFDVVILDLTVAGGPGGPETLARLRDIDPTVHAVLSTGHRDHPVVADWAGAGFAGFIAKPYSVKSLEEALARLL